MARKPRVQVEDPLRRTPDLKVLPLAPDVFVGAPRVSGAGSGLLDLADALSGLANTTGAIAKLQKKKQDDAAEEAFKRLPRDQRIEAIRSGNVPGTAYGVSVGAAKIGGIDAVDKATPAIMADVEAADPRDPSINADTIAGKHLEPLYHQFAGNRGALAGVTEKAFHLRQQIQSAWDKRVLGAKKEDQTQAVFTGLNQATSDAVYAGLTPEQATQHIVKRVNEMKDNPLFDTSLLSKDEMDDQVLALSGRIVDTHPEIALKLINDPRVGVKGEQVGPIAQKEKNAKAALSILEKGNKVLKDRATTEVKNTIADTMLQRALGGENVSVVDVKHLDDNKNVNKITKEDVLDAFDTKYKVYSAAEASRMHETPEQTMSREIRERANSGVVNKEWKDLFHSTFNGLSEQSLQDQGKMTEMQQGLALYTKMRAAFPQYLEQHLDKNTSQLLDFMWLGKNRLGMTDDQAFSAALRATDPNATDQSHVRVQKEVSDALARSKFANEGEVYKQLNDTAKMYAKLGLGAEKAIELAKERLKVDGAEINGWWVPIPRDQNGNMIATPAKFPELAEQMIQEWHAKHGSKEMRVDDLTLASRGNGVFTIVDKRSGLPVVALNVDGNTATRIPMFTSKDFVDLDKNNQRVKNDKLLKDSIEGQNIDQLIRSGDYKTVIDNAIGENAHWQQQFLQALKIVTRKSFWLGKTDPAVKDIKERILGGVNTYTDKDTGKTGVSVGTTPERLKEKGHTNIKSGLGEVLPKRVVGDADKNNPGNDDSNIAP